LEQKLTAAQNEANFILETDKEVLIQKNLEELSGGKPKGFKVLFESVDMAVGQVNEAMGGLQRETEAATDCVQSKILQAVVEWPAKEEQPAMEEQPAGENPEAPV
jgi:hypothetical protein